MSESARRDTFLEEEAVDLLRSEARSMCLQPHRAEEGADVVDGRDARPGGRPVAGRVPASAAATAAAVAAAELCIVSRDAVYERNENFNT